MCQKAPNLSRVKYLGLAVVCVRTVVDSTHFTLCFGAKIVDFGPIVGELCVNESVVRCGNRYFFFVTKDEHLIFSAVTVVSLGFGTGLSPCPTVNSICHKKGKNETHSP